MLRAFCAPASRALTDTAARMFTGIIKAVGTIVEISPTGNDLSLHVDTGALSLDDAQVGDSICVSGTCLTVVELTTAGFWADVSRETLECTTLGELGSNSRVNLEPSLTPSTAMGGHLVSGHVDGKARVVERQEDGRSTRFSFDVPTSLARYVAAKGSICVDGISLTVNTVSGTRFSVNIIPHTLEVTTLGERHEGDRVNIEVDVVARYLERLIPEPGGA